jgi:DNA invertase Pin-like site-specific DNA recombinase
LPVWPAPIAILQSRRRARFLACGRRKGPRSRAEIEQERQALWQRTHQEIEVLAAEFHTLLPRDQAEAVGAIYARYSTRFQDSISDQVRSIFQEAVRRKIFIPAENIFFDMAVRGCKNEREGLNNLRALLSRKEVNVLLLFATNRLFRKMFRTLEFVDKVVKEWGVRCVFIKSGIDTDDKKRREMLLYANSMIDQFVVTLYADNVRAAHEGLLEKLLVFGTISFGYTGEPIPGQLTKRGRPRCRLVIDPETGKFVLLIFRWYVEDCVPIDEIARRLQADPTVPLPPRCTTEAWNHGSVRGVLTNARYRGWWEYGKTETVWLSSKDYARQVRRSEPLKEVQVEELRIVSDELWFAAQKRLAEEIRLKAGRKSKNGDRRSRPRVLTPTGLTEPLLEKTALPQRVCSTLSHGALDVEDADFPVVVFGPVLLGPVVDRASRCHVVAQGQKAVVFALALNSVRRLNDQPDADASVSGGDKSLTYARNPIDGVAHNR